MAIFLYLVLNLYIFVSSLVALGLINNTNKPVGWQLFLKLLFYFQGLVMPLMRCTEQAFIVLIKRRIKQHLYVLSCGFLRLDKELAESLDERLSFLRLDSEFLVSEAGDDTILISDKIEDELKIRSKLSSQDKLEDAETEQMPPLFFFLASSFNVELVYIILKGIT